MLGTSAARGGLQTVDVLYAGSLVTPMEGPVKAALLSERGIDFEGQPGGSKALANLILAGVRTPDAFLCVDPKLVEKLGDRVASTTTFAGTSIGVAWSPKSRFNDLFESVLARQTTLWLALARPGLKIGRTDPQLDPKGGYTIEGVQMWVGHDRAQQILGRTRIRPRSFPKRISWRESTRARSTSAFSIAPRPSHAATTLYRFRARLRSPIE